MLGTARIAGIQAAKRTGELIPLCHPLALDHVDVEAERRRGGRDGDAHRRGRASPRAPGVEMEAMTAARVAALTVYDMVKGLERGVTDRARSCCSRRPAGAAALGAATASLRRACAPRS